MPDIKVNCIVNCNIKLSEPTKEIFLSTPLAYNNTLAHAMRVTVFNDDGTEADLTGVGVTGVFLRADDNAVDPINGDIVESASGVKNIAEIILPASCYIVPGRFTFSMNLTAGSATRTALWVEGHVKRNTSGTIIDPGTPVGNIEQAIGNANSAASAANAAAETATQAAAAAQDVADNVEGEVDEIKSALHQQITDVEILHDKGTNAIQPQASEYINYAMSNGYPGQPNSARAIGPYIYLPINANAVWGVASGYAFTATCQYDRYHNYIGQYTALHANARYMRFCIRKDDNTNISPAEAAAAFSFTLTYDSDYITKSQGKNLLDQTKAVNGYISNNAGAITTAGSAYHTSDYIPIASGQKITISPSVRIFLAFDTSKSPITESYMNTETDNYTYTATADGYVRFSYRDQNADITQAEYGATVTPYAPYQTEVEPDIHLNEAMRSDVQGIIGGESITGKKFLLFGDSIMHGAGNSNYGVGDILQEKYAMSFWDYCESGALVEYKEGRTQTPVYQQIANAITAGRSPDFIIMDGLSNDINAGTLGEMSADFDYVTHGYNTFGAALEYCFGQLRTSYPEIPVLYVIPHSSNARDYALELQFGNLAREICKKWSVPIADVYRDGNMTARIPAQLQTFTYYPTETSGTHPNCTGYDFAYMPLIISWLKNVYANID